AEPDVGRPAGELLGPVSPRRVMPTGRGSGRQRASPRTSAGELSGLDAGRAHAQPLGRPVDGGPDDLDVGVPAARGAAVRVGDPVAEARPLAADVADSSHGIAPLVWLRKLDAAPAPPGPAVEGYPTPAPRREPGRGDLFFEPMVSLDEPLRGVVGGKAASRAEKAFGLRTTGDLLRHYPRRYVRRGELTDLASLRDGEDVTVFAQVAKVTSRRMKARRGRLLEVTVTDGSARLALTFFNKVEYWERQLSPGRHGMFAGRVSTFAGKRQLAHPEFKLLGADDADKAAEYAAELIPVYPATRDLSSWDIEKCVRVVLDTLGEVVDPLPEDLRERHGLDGLTTALLGIHRPDDLAEADRARTRLKWDEALMLQAVLAQRRRAAAAQPATARPPRAGGLLDAFDARLPF